MKYRQSLQRTVPQPQIYVLDTPEYAGLFLEFIVLRVMSLFVFSKYRVFKNESNFFGVVHDFAREFSRRASRISLWSSDSAWSGSGDKFMVEIVHTMVKKMAASAENYLLWLARGMWGYYKTISFRTNLNLTISFRHFSGAHTSGNNFCEAIKQH